jgi:glutathione S-transferase
MTCKKTRASKPFPSFKKAFLSRLFPTVTCPTSPARLYLRRFSGKNHADKAPILRQLIEKHRNDAFLKEAYEKRPGILEFTESTLHSLEQMHEVMETIYRSMDQLETQLAGGPFSNGGWLCGRRFTQADLEWSAMLRRFHMLRLEPKVMATIPHCARYQAKLFARPAFMRRMIDWENPVRQIFLPLIWKKITGRLGIS